MIKYLELKLSGQEPVTRIELIELVNSWGRISNTMTFDKIEIEKCEQKECYDLSNLDVSKIKNMDSIFRWSKYNGDLSKWNVNNCINMDRIFSRSNFNNNSISNWNISNVKSISFAFWGTNFNQNISNWNVSNVVNMKEMFAFSLFDGDISKWKFNIDVFCDYIFEDNKSFENKYNYGNKISYKTKDFLIWFQSNRDKIKDINTSKEEILDFFSFDSNLNKEIICETK